jgi:hypothetical protein
VLGALLGAPAQFLHAPGELVAQPLELLEAEQAGTGRRRGAGGGADVRKAVRHDRRHLPLEPGDLPAQRPAGRALAELGLAQKDVAGCVPIDRWLRGLAHADSFTSAKRDGFYQRS